MRCPRASSDAAESRFDTPRRQHRATSLVAGCLVVFLLPSIASARTKRPTPKATSTTNAGRAGAIITGAPGAAPKGAPKGTPKAGRDARGRYLPQGAPPLPAVAFQGDLPGAAIRSGSEIISVLIIGSDARPKEDMARTRADSLHLLVWNPKSKTGTLLGIPRDTYVSIPGKGKNKITAALSLGGPATLVAAVRDLTGIPVSSYVLTGFTGFTAMVNGLGGVNVKIDAMNDTYSGAQFSGGWYAVNGDAALAFTRNRHDVPGGDFGRSMNQGRMLLAALAKLRAEASSPADLARWLTVLTKFGRTNMTSAQLMEFAGLARSIDTAQLTNTLLPARNAKVGKAAVVLPTTEAPAFLARIKETGTP